MDFLNRTARPTWALAGVLLLVWFVYRPGLSGGFLFDDFVNLPALGGMGAIDDAAAFWRYITSGSADPTGRPVALLSFLIDANDWPADPAPFLRTSLLLHLLNGALLYVLLRQLGGRLDGGSARTDAAAVVGAGAWLLHPLFVSTTLYIVQREAMLPATFTLLGLIAWVHGRGRLASNPRRGIAWMVGGLGGCTILAVLSKGNGILLPLLAWVVDACVLRPTDAPALRADRRLRVLRTLLLVFPSALLLAWLGSKLQFLQSDYGIRPWTIAQRLLTEPRVLIEYLQLLVVPRVLSTGLYNDGYVASTSLLTPWTTLPALLAVIALVVAGFALRRRAPSLSCAILFYFAGHLIESTVFPLELYFEHRNYLPAMLLGWPLARSIVRLPASVAVRATVSVLLLALLASITWQRASLWSRQDDMALLWAAQNPTSSRAQATAAIFEMQRDPQRAVARLERPATQNPNDLQLVLNFTSARCATGGLAPADVDRVTHALRHAREGEQLVHGWLGRGLDMATTGQCRGIDLETIDRWLAATRANPHIMGIYGRVQDLHSLEGRLALVRQQPDDALHAFDLALAVDPTPQVVLQQAGVLASAGCYTQALKHLDQFSPEPEPRPHGLNMKRVHAWVLDRQGFWAKERAYLRASIAEDLRREGQAKCGK